MTEHPTLFDRKRAPEIFGVSRLVNYIGNLIRSDRQLSAVRVRGEISELSRPVSGHVYFSLKEKTDLLRCVVWSSNAGALPAMENGQEVICSGDCGIYAGRSQFQLFVTSVEHFGIGRLFAQFQADKERLAREGLFETTRKRPMPAFPLRIAVVSAPGAKGADDFLKTISRRAPQVEITLVETLLQGDGAQIEIAAAIDRASRLPVDVIVVTRGGGSYEDLFPFNLEPVVRAIARAKRPVLTAIGHTADWHLADMAADYACKTPTEAAEYFGRIRDAAMTRVANAVRSLNYSIRGLVTAHGQRFDNGRDALEHCARNFAATRGASLWQMEKRLAAQTPQMRLTRRSQLLSSLQPRLEYGGRNALRSPVERLRLLAVRLQGADPTAPLSRGFAIVTVRGRTLRDAGLVSPGEAIEARVQRGRIEARVERTHSDG